MSYSITLFLTGIFALGLLAPAGAAVNPPEADQYYRARVVAIPESGAHQTEEGPAPYQKVEVELLDGDRAGQRVIIEHGDLFSIRENQLVAVGETVVVTKPGGAPQDTIYYISDTYRASRLALLVAGFFALTVLLGRKKGFMSFVGLSISVLIIFYGMVPAIMRGQSPLGVALLGCLAIVLTSFYLSHGFNRRITLALISTLITLGLALILDFFMVYFAKLSGTSTEESFYLQLSAGSIDLRGLLLAGILLSVLGVLDDVTTAQAAAVEELHRANPSFTARQLYQRGLSIGREHIASLVNTLVLAYVGVSFPLILLISLGKAQPLWLLINSNFIAEELVRTLVGSSALIVAVPITTALTAYWLKRLRA